MISIPDSATVLEACEFFTLHRLLAFPVVDASHRIIGRSTSSCTPRSSTTSTASSGATTCFSWSACICARPDRLRPGRAFVGRFPWLLCNIAGGLLAAVLAEFFAAELKRVVALALFIPVVLALAESVSIQSVSLTLQTLRGQRPTLAELLAKLRRELWTGGLLGVASGGVGRLGGLDLVGTRDRWPCACCWASAWESPARP